jgi:two-component system response regulator
MLPFQRLRCSTFGLWFCGFISPRLALGFRHWKEHTMAPTILLIEDDPNDELLVRIALEQQSSDWEIVVARDGAEAAEYLFGTGRYQGRNPQESPRLILVDLNTPGMSGLKFLQLLQNVRPPAKGVLPPVVVFSSSSDPRDVGEAYRLGAQSFVRKPVAFSEFREVASAVVSYWLNLSEPRCDGGNP